MYVLIAGIAFIGLSSTKSGSTEPSEGIYPGDLFPEFDNIVKSDSGTFIKLSDLKGRKVLVNFWAAYDARSRRDNILMSNLVEKENYPVKMISLSLDQSESVFERTILSDKIDKKNQFRIDNQAQVSVLKTYRMEKEFKSYLINENGKIIAINPTSERLDQLLKSN